MTDDGRDSDDTVKESVSRVVASDADSKNNCEMGKNNLDELYGGLLDKNIEVLATEVIKITKITSTTSTNKHEGMYGMHYCIYMYMLKL